MRGVNGWQFVAVQHPTPLLLSLPKFTAPLPIKPTRSGCEPAAARALACSERWMIRVTDAMVMVVMVVCTCCCAVVREPRMVFDVIKV